MKAVILSFNHPGITEKCVLSALKFFKESDIILVHNGSRKECVDQIKNIFPKVHHLEFQDNRGYSGGANRGLKFAFENGAENVLFLSNDTKLEKIEFSIPKNKAFLCAPKIELRETGQTHSLGGELQFWNGKLRHLIESKAIGETFYIPGAAFLINREAWILTNGFDESLGSYWEDVDLSFRAKKLGVKLLLTSDVVIKHAIGKTCGGDPYYTLYSFHRNRKVVTLRHSPLWGKILFSGVYTVDTLGKLFKFTKNRDFKRVKLLLRATVSW